jgi:hypothetical protein
MHIQQPPSHRATYQKSIQSSCKRPPTPLAGYQDRNHPHRYVSHWHPHACTITSLNSLFKLHTDLHDKLISKTPLANARIHVQLHLHIVQWLHQIHFIYHLRSRKTSRRSSYTTSTTPNPSGSAPPTRVINSPGGGGGVE